MIKKQLIILKVVISAHDNHKLKLLDDDFENLVKGKKFDSIKIEFDDNVIIDFTKSMLLYLEDGTLAQKGRISKWITDKGLTNEPEKKLVLFELTIDEKNNEHYYRFLGNGNELYERIGRERMKID